ncbi:MAG: serine hydrolase [Proteobacteria bacterium]|nr:serine hydrolase [Pseudomonadota bacterium]
MVARRLLSLLGLLVCMNVAYAATPVPSPPSIAGDSHILVDFRTGRVLAEQNADKQVDPASITKIMTSYVVFKQLESGSIALDDLVSHRFPIEKIENAFQTAHDKPPGFVKATVVFPDPQNPAR